MCNHYAKNVEVIAMGLRELEPVGNWALNDEGDIVPPDNAALHATDVWPKSRAPIFLQTEERNSVAWLRWGIKCDVQGATKRLTKYVTNARDDKLTSFTWRYALAERRCLIPATGYYEPDGPAGGKWEVRFTLRDQPMFFLAGLWDRDPDGTRAFTMVTTGPNELAAQIHDRMPLVLDPAAAREWLGFRPLAPDRLRTLCRPFPSERMESVALPPPTKKIRAPELREASQSGELELGLEFN